MVQYELPGNTVSLATMFSKMEEAQRDLNIEDYSVSQNTLDNVRMIMIRYKISISCVVISARVRVAFVMYMLLAACSLSRDDVSGLH